MLALVGFVFQHLAYPGTGPVENLVAHVKDPYHVTCVPCRRAPGPCIHGTCFLVLGS